MPPTRQTVCIIEDDESVRRALRRLIRAAGLNAVTFSTAEEFLRSSAQPAPACLILDVRLPGMSGLELQKQLGAQGRTAGIVFISAYWDEAVLEQAMRAGAIAFLHKPFEEHLLLGAVKRAVSASILG